MDTKKEASSFLLIEYQERSILISIDLLQKKLMSRNIARTGEFGIGLYQTHSGA